MTTTNRILNIPVIVAALGYFVDIYDLILFSIVRVKSLKSLNLDEKAVTDVGLSLINWQMSGMLLGGILWGILGDKRGRVSVLFGSILMYSLANIANGFVMDETQYKVLRFIAGIGLAGELGGGITLVSEVMTKETRGYGTAIVASVGILGGILAYFVSEIFDWRTAYIVGGVLGLCLLVLRISVYESGMYNKMKDNSVQKGNFFQLFSSRERFVKYISCILIGIPVWYVVGLLITFSPELAKSQGLPFTIEGGKAVLWCYLGLSSGDLLTGLLSQYFRTRKKVVLVFQLFTLAMVVLYLLFPAASSNIFYGRCFFLGLGIGYWALFVTIGAEQFGTNLRATVTTSVPNFVRGAVPLITMSYVALKSQQYPATTAALIVGIVSCVIAILAVFPLQETFGKDLDYLEKDE
jgi:MFS transporter, putative metabolite:H+ symporter